jgi:hypothetical protein
MKPPAVALGSDDEAAGRFKDGEWLPREREAFLLVRTSRQLFGEGLSYFALVLTFHPAAGHLICGPLQAVVFPALFCWFALRVRRRLRCGIFLGGFHFIHLSFR